MFRKSILPWLVFPVLAGGGMITAGVLIAAGVQSGMVVMAINAVAVAAIFALERFTPHHQPWSQTQQDVRTDLLHMSVSMLAVPEVARILLLGSLTTLSVWLSARVGASLWPVDAPLWIQVVMALLIAEFGSYWTHRLFHEHDALWRLHAVHHSAPRLYWLNAGRFHPLDTLISWFFGVPLLLILGCPGEPIALFLLFTAIHGMMQHANIRIRLGPLNWIFSMAELHRWHHSKTIEESNSNYGANLIFWDIVFGTRFLPSDREAPTDIGIFDMPNFPKGYLAQLLTPFRWAKTKAESGVPEA